MHNDVVAVAAALQNLQRTAKHRSARLQQRSVHSPRRRSDLLTASKTGSNNIRESLTEETVALPFAVATVTSSEAHKGSLHVAGGIQAVAPRLRRS